MKPVEVHHEFIGSADAPVLMLAGPLGSTLDIWEPHVEQWADRFRVLRYDHRGHGRSPVPSGPYEIADLGGDALALLDRLEIEQAAFCGLSMGGMAGIWLAAHAPERVSSLVLCSTTARYDDFGPWIDREAAVRFAGTSAVAPEVVRGWFTPEWAAEQADVVKSCVDMISNTSDEGYISCCSAIAAWDGRRLLSRINTPTLVLGAKRDRGTPVSPHAKTLTAAIYAAKLEVLDAAHLAVIENADRAHRLISWHLTKRK